jgi:hypothetical protein
MCKLGMGIKVAKKNFEISLNLMTVKIESRILPQVWTKGGNRVELQIPPINIDLKKKKNQYKSTEETIPHSLEGRLGLNPHK